MPPQQTSGNKRDVLHYMAVWSEATHGMCSYAYLKVSKTSTHLGKQTGPGAGDLGTPGMQMLAAFQPICQAGPVGSIGNL